MKTPDDAEAFDRYDPANVSPFVAYLATADCPYTGETFYVGGGAIRRVRTWEYGETLDQQARWTIEGIAARADELVPPAESA
jgi:hypothetical protein